MVAVDNRAELRDMFQGALQYFEGRRDEVDNLNVFPVPDGDTGTNMHLTLLAAVKNLNDSELKDFDEFAEVLSRGALMGARGNSGVILAQILRGFSMGIQGKDKIDGRILANCFHLGDDVAYKAVKNPVKGTILTVMKAVAKVAEQAASRKNDFLFVLDESISAGRVELEKTPDYLPVLKEAGVVDAGGYGLILLLEGIHKAALGEVGIFETPEDVIFSPVVDHLAMSEEDIRFGYCTEFIIMNPKEDGENIREYLDDPEQGDSLVTIVADGIAKVHMHTNHPGELLEYALSLGDITNIKIENMREQFIERKKKETQQKAAQVKPFGFVMVVAGNGLGEIAESMGVDAVLNGGQTMNPSTNDIHEAIDQVNAKTVYVFPNNKNIILACEQTIELVKDKKVVVVPTTNIAEGFTSLLAFNETKNPRENLVEMKKACDAIATGSITYAVRDTSLNGVEIKKGQILTTTAKDILGAVDTVEEAVDIFMDKMYDGQDIITLYYGEMVSDEEAEEMQARLSEKYPDADVEIFSGKQPVYYYFISLE